MFGLGGECKEEKGNGKDELFVQKNHGKNYIVSSKLESKMVRAKSFLLFWFDSHYVIFLLNLLL